MYYGERLQRKERKCLKCQKMFNSLGPSNRRCDRCEQKLKEQNPIYIKPVITTGPSSQ